MKKEKKQKKASKLNLERFQISKLSNPRSIMGGSERSQDTQTNISW